MNIHKNARLTPQGRLLLVECTTEGGLERRAGGAGRGHGSIRELRVPPTDPRSEREARRVARSIPTRLP